MEKKRLDDYEPGLVPPPAPLDRFGFVKPELNNSPDGLAKGRSANEYERYAFLLLIMENFYAEGLSLTSQLRLPDFDIHWSCSFTRILIFL